MITLKMKVTALTNGGFLFAHIHPVVCPSKQDPGCSKEDRIKVLTNISQEEEKVNETNLHKILCVLFRSN